MNCNEFKEMMSDYIDDELDSYQKNLFVEHMKECKSCMSEYLLFRKIIDDIHELPMEELPKGYCKKLRAGLDKAKADKKKLFRISFIKYASAAAVFVLVLSGIYSATMNMKGDYSLESAPKYADTNNYDGSMNYNTAGEANKADKKEETSNEMMDSSNTTGSEGGQFTANNKLNTSPTEGIEQNKSSKIIKTCTIGTNTLEYDQFTTHLIDLIRSENGYVEYNRTYTNYKTNTREYKSGEIKLRVPQESFDSIIAYINSDSEVYNQIVNEDDVTKYYYDTENIVKNLKIQEERLRELYSQAQNITEILALESEINRVRTDIDSYSITLSDIDDRASMSTITLDITEIEGASIAAQPTDSMWKKASRGIVKTIHNIVNSAQNFIIWLITNIPYLIIIGIVAIIVIIVVKRKTKTMK